MPQLDPQAKMDSNTGNTVSRNVSGQALMANNLSFKQSTVYKTPPTPAEPSTTFTAAIVQNNFLSHQPRHISAPMYPAQHQSMSPNVPAGLRLNNDILSSNEMDLRYFSLANQPQGSQIPQAQNQVSTPGHPRVYTSGAQARMNVVNPTITMDNFQRIQWLALNGVHLDLNNHNTMLDWLEYVVKHYRHVRAQFHWHKKQADQLSHMNAALQKECSRYKEAFEKEKMLRHADKEELSTLRNLASQHKLHCAKRSHQSAYLTPDSLDFAQNANALGSRWENAIPLDAEADSTSTVGAETIPLSQNPIDVDADPYLSNTGGVETITANSIPTDSQDLRAEDQPLKNQIGDWYRESKHPEIARVVGRRQSRDAGDGTTSKPMTKEERAKGIELYTQEQAREKEKAIEESEEETQENIGTTSTNMVTVKETALPISTTKEPNSTPTTLSSIFLSSSSTQSETDHTTTTKAAFATTSVKRKAGALGRPEVDDNDSTGRKQGEDDFEWYKRTKKHFDQDVSSELLADPADLDEHQQTQIALAGIDDEWRTKKLQWNAIGRRKRALEKQRKDEEVTRRTKDLGYQITDGRLSQHPTGLSMSTSGRGKRRKVSPKPNSRTIAQPPVAKGSPAALNRSSVKATKSKGPSAGESLTATTRATFCTNEDLLEDLFEVTDGEQISVDLEEIHVEQEGQLTAEQLEQALLRLQDADEKHERQIWEEQQRQEARQQQDGEDDESSEED